MTIWVVALLVASSVVVASLSLAGASGSGISWVQGTYVTPPTGTGASAALANVGAGHVLVASVNVGAGYTESGGLSGSGPGALSWTKVASRTGSQSQITLWYAVVPTSGSYTVSAAATGPEIALALDEYAGVASTGTIVTSGTNAGTSKKPTATAAVTAPAGSLVVGSFTWNSVKAGVTAGSGYTLRQLYGDATMSQPVAVEDRVLAASAKPSAGITLSRRDGWVAVVAVLAPGGSSAPTSTTGTVSGTVKNTGGTALSGATVTVGGTSLSATTSSTGAYSIANVPSGTQSLTASASGYSNQTQSVSVTAGATATLNFSLTATVTTGTVSGTVKNTGGTALSGATVTVAGTSLSATTSSSGAYSIANVPSGTQSLTASASGYNTQTLSVSVTAGATATLNFSLSASASTPAPSGLHVSGNQILDAAGNPVRLHGVNRSGTEYACIQGWGFSDGPDPLDTQATINAVATWHANAIRIPLNEDCWLAINGAPSAYSGANYQSAIKQLVAEAETAGLYPILELHWSAPGTTQATGQNPMPDADHSVTFWSQVATTFKGDGRVIFEPFNEPYPDNNQDTTTAWSCWKNGGSSCNEGYSVAGMQTIVTAIRNAGASNLVLLGGVEYSNSLSQWLTYRPSDPANNLGAAWHVYDFNICDTVTCFNNQVAPVAAAVPVVTTEVGSQNGGTFLDTVLQWDDSHGLGYLAWTWDVWGGWESLITDYTGTPAAGEGQDYHTYLTTHY